MKVDRVMLGSLADVRATAVSAERAGVSGVFVGETSHDPFLPMVPVALDTERVDLGTAIAVAFARNPMTLANLAYDLQLYSRGRFVLGLGSQIAPHVIRRFSMPWSKPVGRMRELVSAIRAIWACWNDDVALDFQGEFYTHTLMTPMFNPGPNPYGLPRIFLAAVGTRMTEVAGEVADGMLAHTFTTARYLQEETLPALTRGRRRSRFARQPFEVSLNLLVATGRDESELQAAVQAVRKQLAFYGSTPAYRVVLEKHGWEAAHEELHALSKQGEWAKMADVFDDEMLSTFAVVGEPTAVAATIRQRYTGLVDRVMLALFNDKDDALLNAIVAAM